MATEPKSRRRRRKKILRKNDGSLYDATERRRITSAELRDYVRDGGLFEARRQENGADCTYEVLQSVVGVGVLENLVPGLGGGSLPGLGGLGGLGALAGGGPLGALTGGGGGLGDLARLVSDQIARNGDRDHDDWEAPRRRTHRRSSGDWGDDDGDWSDRSDRPRRSSPDRGWRDTDWSDPPRRSHRSDDEWASDPDFD
jgi:hypothetical protein